MITSSNSLDSKYFVLQEESRCGNDFVSELPKTVLEAFKKIIPDSSFLLDKFPQASVFYECKNITTSHILQPEIISLKLLSKHYWDKYKVCILFAQKPEDIQEIIFKIKELNVNYIGIIDASGKSNKMSWTEDRHVTAMIYDKKNKKWMIIDSRGSQIKTHGDHMLFSTPVLQRGDHVCRVGSMIILRNALRDLQKNPDVKFDPDLPPARWISACQSIPKNSLDEMLNHQINEKKFEKISEFRKRYTQEVKVEYDFTIQIPCKIWENFIKDQQLPIEKNESTRAKLKLDKTYKGKGTQTYNWMTYLVIKSAKLPEKISKIRECLKENEEVKIEKDFNSYLISKIHNSK